MQKTFYDLCPVSNKKENVTIEYKPYSGLDLEKTYYAKSHFSCSNSTCKHTSCPLFYKAPSNF